MDRPLVSIVIATYNMAKYLPLAVRSALDQTYKNVEIVIVDDGSTDETRSVVEPFLSDARVKYVLQENKGQAAAKNHGVRAASGGYIAFLDADDMWTPNKLELQIPLFEQSPHTGVVCSQFIYVDETGKELRVSTDQLHRGRVSGPLFIFNFVGFGTSVARRECFDRLGGFKEDLRMGIDYDLWLRFSTQYEFDYVDRPLLYYRVWSGQMSGNWKSRYQSGIEIMRTFLRDFPGAVDKRTEEDAWAFTYWGLGQCFRTLDRSMTSAIGYYLRAMRHRPLYVPAWKGIVAAVLRI